MVGKLQEKKVLRTILLFSLLSFPLYLPYFVKVKIPFLPEFYAFVVSKIVNIIEPTSVHGNSVIGRGFVFLVDDDCTGWEAGYLSSILFLLTPKTSLRDKVKFLFFSLILLFFLNLFRLTSICILISSTGEFPKLYHLTWQFILPLFSVGFWFLTIGWKKYMEKNRDIDLGSHE
ncbi:MAG: archaeosortase/exosortase family protein [Candidatus Aenigmarchaeota archaeon]|nr:archaeosortase/exosortase family protein [Candidatus Aenigmarchaeota archaeon]